MHRELIHSTRAYCPPFAFCRALHVSEVRQGGGRQGDGALHEGSEEGGGPLPDA